MSTDNNKVAVLDNGSFGFESISEFLFSNRFKLIKGDIRIKEDVLRALQEVDTIIHLASLVGEPACNVDKDISYDINVIGTRNLLLCAEQLGIKNFIFASSCSVYGFGQDTFTEDSLPNPVDYYAELKLMSEKDLLAYKDKMDIIVLRFCTVFGLSKRMRFDLAVNIMTANAVTHGVIDVYGGQQERPFIHCEDIAVATVMLLNKHFKNGVFSPGIEVYNIGNNSQNYNLTDIAWIISNTMDNTSISLDGSKEDNRSYHVSFDKIEKLGFQVKKSVEVGVKEIANNLTAGVVMDPYSDIYSNLAIAEKQYIKLK